MSTGTKMRMRPFFLYMDEYQRHTQPPARNHAGRRFTTLPSMGRIRAMNWIGMAREKFPIAPGDELVQVEHYTAHDFVNTHHMISSLEEFSFYDIEIVMVFRNPASGMITVKNFSPHSLESDSPWALVYIQPMINDVLSNVLLKGLYVRFDEDQNYAIPRHRNETGQRYSTLRTIAKVVSMRYESMRRNQMRMVQGVEIVQIDDNTADDFRSARHVKQYIREEAKTGIKIVVRHPITGVLDAKIVHSGLLKPPGPYAQMDVQVMWIDTKQKELFIKMNRHQLLMSPYCDVYVAFTLPTIGVVTAVREVGFERPLVDSIKPGDEIVTIDGRSMNRFKSTAQMMATFDRKAKKGVTLLFRNQLYKTLDRKITRSSLTDGPGSYLALKVQMKKINKVTKLRQMGLFIRPEQNTNIPISDEDRARYQTLCPIAKISTLHYVGMGRTEIGIPLWAEIIQVNNLTANNFFSKRQTAEIIYRLASRGVQLVMRSPTKLEEKPKELYIKTFYLRPVSSRKPHTVVKFRIYDFPKASTIDLNRVYVQYDMNEICEEPSLTNEDEKPFALLQPLGNISSIQHQTKCIEGMRLQLADELLQIGNLTAANFRRTSQISYALKKRAKGGIDVIVRNPVTGQLRRCIFRTKLSDAPLPHAIVNLQLKMPELYPFSLAFPKLKIEKCE
ncbi:uncharacterized protein LOC128306814 [Anopheles moucheti]|uniref:uncharacterized protein LOC128306814 n=1 Tax=Anopheles moucheti TaxID=186751 RepID=UPI0022F06E57|nr:uncharacterized protein LOC128306814 [Anopheles moucheti]